jgi:hypothetical protein
MQLKPLLGSTAPYRADISWDTTSRATAKFRKGGLNTMHPIQTPFRLQKFCAFVPLGYPPPRQIPGILTRREVHQIDDVD